MIEMLIPNLFSNGSSSRDAFTDNIKDFQVGRKF